MARLHATERTGQAVYQWTQFQCDGCGTLDPTTTQGHEHGVMNPPSGWKLSIVGGTLRAFCPACH